MSARAPLAARSGVWRFVAGGLRDAVRRVARVTAPLPADERRVVEVFEASVAIRALEGAAARIKGAIDSSAVRATADHAATAWTRQAPPARRHAGGAVLLVAVAVHLGLTGWHGAPPGWMWLILPGLAAAIGATLVALSGSTGHAGGRR